jgi:hypothetical protein
VVLAMCENSLRSEALKSYVEGKFWNEGGFSNGSKLKKTIQKWKKGCKSVALGMLILMTY